MIFSFETVRTNAWASCCPTRNTTHPYNKIPPHPNEKPQTNNQPTNPKTNRSNTLLSAADPCHSSQSPDKTFLGLSSAKLQPLSLPRVPSFFFHQASLVWPFPRRPTEARIFLTVVPFWTPPLFLPVPGLCLLSLERLLWTLSVPSLWPCTRDPRTNGHSLGKSSSFPMFSPYLREETPLYHRGYQLQVVHKQGPGACLLPLTRQLCRSFFLNVFDPESIREQGSRLKFADKFLDPPFPFQRAFLRECE